MRTAKAMTVQTLILSKETFDREAAIAWVKDHDFVVKPGAPDETEDSWRFRQREPSEFQEGTFRTIEITDGVKAVVGQPKEEKKMDENLERGNALLLPLDLTVECVHTLELAIDRFRGVAAAKAWAVNHGMPPREIRQLRDSILAMVRPAGDFEEGSLHREKLSRDVSALVGTPVQRREAEPVRRAVPDADASNEEKREAQRARAERWGIEALEGKGENLSFPAGGPTDENLYADPVNLKYPVESEERAANARVRFKQNADVYERESSKRVIHERIVRAELKFGIEPSFDPDDPLDALLPADLKDQLSKTVKFAKRGEVFVVKAEEGEEEDVEKEVRFFGIVMKPSVADVEGDAQTATEIERANDRFMREFQTIGFMHAKDVSEKVRILQNVIAPIDLDFPLPDGTEKRITKGTWYQQLFSDDAEIVDRVRSGKLNGLSIGGKAKRVPADEVGPEGPEELQLAKRANLERVAKGEGDPIKNWFVGLLVEEVSIVDAGANEEELFFIKRRPEMSTKDKSPEAPVTTPVVKDAPQPPAAPDPKTPTPSDPPTPVVAEDPPPPAEDPKPVERRAPELDLAGIEKAVGTAVSKSIEPLEARIAALEGKVEKQGEAVSRAEAVRAAAKGEAVPSETATPDPKEPEVKKSKWAGSAVGQVFSRSRR